MRCYRNFCKVLLISTMLIFTIPANAQAQEGDSDGDGVDDNEDDFPNDANETTDTDGDGVGDNADEDDDGDGTPDTSDAFPLDPNESSDIDGDGVGDNADAFPNDSAEALDSDSDGVGDNADAFPLDSNETADSDYDGMGDNADEDDDGDGTPDTSDAFPLDPNESSDIDGDGVGDNSDDDDDGDGWTDAEEYQCDSDPLSFNSQPNDYDDDQICDPLDDDDDNDGWSDNLENECDTLPMNFNSTPTDTDYDGVCNLVDVDDDGDGIADYDDLRPLTLDSFDYGLYISGDENSLNLKMKYTVPAVAVMQYVVIADLYGDNSNSVNTGSEKDYMEATLCSSPTPFAEYGEDPIWSPTRWVLNVTVDDSKPPISDDSCSWEDRRDLPPTSLLDTAELEIEYTLEISGSGTSIELLIPDFSWDSEYWFFNGAFEVECQGEWECDSFTLYAAQGATTLQLFHSSPDSQIGAEEPGEVEEIPGFGVLSAICVLTIVALCGPRKDRGTW